MSTNKVTENPSADQHYRADALIATGATLSVLILGGVLQFISPKVTPEKTPSEDAVSQPAVTYSTSISTPGNQDAASPSAAPTADTNQQVPLVTENLSTTSQPMTETAATAPETTAPVTTATETTAPVTTAPETTAPVTAESTITDPATLQTLNSQIFSKINDNWTATPTFTSSLVYQIDVAESGAIVAYEAINESAKNYSKEVPLPSLVDATAKSDKTAKFLVVFTPSGQLEISPWISEN